MLLGPQGSGKGTQADLLVERKGFVHLEMGELLRNRAEVQEILDRGDLVPDEYVQKIAWDFVNEHGPKNTSLVFDGYPRSVGQYEIVKEMLKKFGKTIDRVINITISEEETIKRLSSRRTCEKCGAVFNIVTNPPKEPEKCDECGAKLGLRDDDQPEAIKERLKNFWATTEPVLEQAKLEGIETEIDGERPIEEIYKDIEKVLGL